MIVIALISAVVLVVIDQIIKLFVINNIAIGQSIQVIKFGDKEIFNLTHILNDGAGFSIFSGKTIFLILITLILIVVAIVYLLKYAKRHPLLITSLALVIAGGVGNLIDRVFRKGMVVDYIEARFMNFPIFNFADICVTFGAISLIVFVLFFDKNTDDKQANTVQNDTKETDIPNE